MTGRLGRLGRPATTMNLLSPATANARYGGRPGPGGGTPPAHTRATAAAPASSSKSDRGTAMARALTLATTATRAGSGPPEGRVERRTVAARDAVSAAAMLVRERAVSMKCVSVKLRRGVPRGGSGSEGVPRRDGRPRLFSPPGARAQAGQADLTRPVFDEGGDGGVGVAGRRGGGHGGGGRRGRVRRRRPPPPPHSLLPSPWLPLTASGTSTRTAMAWPRTWSRPGTTVSG